MVSPVRFDALFKALLQIRYAREHAAFYINNFGADAEAAGSALKIVNDARELLRATGPMFGWGAMLDETQYMRLRREFLGYPLNDTPGLLNERMLTLTAGICSVTQMRPGVYCVVFER